MMKNKASSLTATWVRAPIGDLFRVVGGGTPPTSQPEYWNGSIPWITSADIAEDHKITMRKRITKAAITASATNLVPAGSAIVVTRVGLGKVGMAEQDLCFSQDNHALIFDAERFDSRFVVLQMGRLVSGFKHISRGTTISGVTKKQLLSVEFLAPPLREQRRIVAELEKQFTRLEAGVAALRRVQANLKRYRAAVLKFACEGWSTCRLSDACEVLSGYAFKSTDFCASGVRVIKIANISYGSYLDDAPSFLPHSFLPDFRRFSIQTGDILHALSPPITTNQIKTCLYPRDFTDALLTQRFAKLAPTPRILRGYL